MTFHTSLVCRAFVAAGLAAAVWPAGCSDKQAGPTQPAKATAVEDAENAFAVTAPAGWEVKTNPGSAVAAIFSSPGEGGAPKSRASVKVVVEKIPEGMSSKSYVSGNVASLSAGLADEVVLEQKDVVISGLPMRRIVYTHKPDHERIKVLLYCGAKERRGYNITCSAGMADFTKFQTQFEEVAKTFQAR